MNKDELKAALKELQEEEKAGEQKAEKVEADVSKMVDDLGKKIVDAIAASKGLSEGDKKEVKETYFSAKSGMKGIRYPEMNELSSLSKDDKILVWFKALVNKDRDAQAAQVFRALVEGTDDQGGYLVPEEFRAEVFRIMPDMSIMRRLARILPMNTDTLNLNTLAARPTAYWTPEYASKSTTSAEFGRVVLSPNDLVCLLPVTHQLVNDANINVVQFVTELFAEAIATAEDKAFFTGSGTGQPKGINQETLTSISAGGAGTFDHLIGLLHSVPQSIRNAPSSAFVASDYAIRLMRNIKDSQNRYIWEPSVQVGQPDRILGKPIYEQNDIAQSEIYFGDWKFYVIGDRQTLSVETTSVGGEAWRRNAMEIKAVERVDGKTVKTGAFAKITNWR
jgi:HK97 family phage major capsid protein